MDSSGETVRDILARYVERRAAGESVAIEDLCREHASLASELRELIPLADSLLEQLGSSLGTSLHERLEDQFGSGVDPQVSLEREPVSKAEFSSEVLSRLADRGPASTRYRIQGEVAHGGMGAVLRVWDEDLRRHLAMKVMLSQGAAPRLLARFLEEAQVTGQLDHPGIVPVHELGLDGQGRVFFTMKLVKGQTLKDVFEELASGEEGWTQTRVLGLLLKVCEAMSYAHAKGVIHRDLKPANVMVGRFGEVFVMDWGLAKILGRADEKDIRVRADPPLASSAIGSERHDLSSEAPDSTLYTMDGDVVGTPAYMPPEQARGELDAMGPQSDVYALGAMLYQLLAGHPPYLPPGVKASNRALWQLVQRGPPDPLISRSPRAPAELVAICERAMAREIPGRYGDMSVLAADLSAYVEGRVVRAYETGAWAEARKWVRRNKPLAVALASALILALGGLAGVGYVQAAGRKAERTQRDRADAKAQEAEDSARAALDNLRLAQDNEREAKEQRDLARSETAKVLRLSDVKVLQELEASVDELWPAHPDKISALEAWLERARALAARLPEHRSTLEEMRARAHAWSDEERERDRVTHPRVEELAAKRGELDRLNAQRAQSPMPPIMTVKHIEALEAELAGLTEAVQSRRTWTFDSAEDQWQHDVLAELIGNLERLESGLLAEGVITRDHGWSVPKRLEFAYQLEPAFGPGGEFGEAWQNALPAIERAYPGLELKPQMGLVPIGEDPQSGLWEFAHLMTGEPAERGPDGKLDVTEETGLVLVLLRGGKFWMGAQARDPSGANFDPAAQYDEGPVHEVELSPFFISKYEMTQGQWLRLTGRNPSDWQKRDPAPTLDHPVEEVSWLDCMFWLPQAGLALPSEAQWEYSARAGTDTPWWTGREKVSLQEEHAANLADRSATRVGAIWPDINDWPELDDGYAMHAPVGTYSPNPFGLHEVAGNLWEWCMDGMDADYYSRAPTVDPICPWVGLSYRIARGGGYTSSAFLVRSALRHGTTPPYAEASLGVRPTRRIER
jgi:serine/threonine protein kinase/formylglycine-generating enzyme required for sulfatase activity